MQWIVDPVGEAARVAPDRVAVIDTREDASVTYAMLDARVDQIAAGLQSSGVGLNDRIGVDAHHCLDTVELTHALFRVGATAVMLNPETPPARARDYIETVAPAAIITPEPDVWSAHPNILDIETVRARGIDTSVLSQSTDERSVHDPAAVLYTSGSTTEPKAVALTYHNLWHSAVASALRLGIRPDDRWLGCLPFYHMGGFAPIVRSAIYGTGLVLAPFAEMGDVLRDLEITGTSLVPTLLRRAIDRELPLEQLRVVLVGGDRTPPDLVRRVMEAGVSLYVTYGATETSSQAATATPDDLRADPATVGRPLHGITIEVNRDVTEQGDGREGELMISGPTLSPGYVNDSDERLDNGQFRTGDLGHINDTGRLHVTGRRSDRIVSGGVSVDATAIAGMLAEHDTVERAAVVGVPDTTWGERVCAAIVTEERIAPEQIVDDLAEHFTPAERPREVRSVDRLPRTASGTVDTQAVRALFVSDTEE